MKKILILQGHPVKDSLVANAAQAYYQGALKENEQVELVHVVDLDFDLVLRNGYKEAMPLEADLVSLQQKIKEADHLVLFYPIWWGTMPALMKGFVDRVFLPDYAFKYTKGIPKKLMKGKTARVITTMNSPWIWYRITGRPGHKMIKNSILSFCGFKLLKLTTFYAVNKSTEQKRKDWLNKINNYGRQDAR